LTTNLNKLTTIIGSVTLGLLVATTIGTLALPAKLGLAAWGFFVGVSRALGALRNPNWGTVPNAIVGAAAWFVGIAGIVGAASLAPALTGTIILSSAAVGGAAAAVGWIKKYKAQQNNAPDPGTEIAEKKSFFRKAWDWLKSS
jgi:hypothetical protein